MFVQDRDRGQEELRKFFQVACHRQFEERRFTNMPGGMIDQVWHDFLLEATAYEEFTADAVGCHIEHLPNRGSGVIDWTTDYEAMFGPLSEVWFVFADGELDLNAYQAYQQTGVMRASWECTPYAIPAPPDHRNPKVGQRNTNSTTPPVLQN